MRHYLLLTCFFVSGLCGLVYQVVWMRLIGHVFGNSVFATATVLAAFMGGLAVGSVFGGRAADRREDRVRLYGLLELAIGVYCVLLPLLLDLATPLYAAVYRRFEGTSALLIVLRAAICGGVLLVPTACMGATLPLLLRHFVKTREGLGRTVGQVYAINTFGAAAGSVLAGFVLIPTLGVAKTTGLAAVLNVAIGLIAIFLLEEKRAGEAEQGREDAQAACEPPDGPTAGAYSRRQVRAAVLAIGVSGFVAMAYEVALTRTFSLLLGSSTYAFSLMVTAFIVGIGLGSMVLTRWVRPGRDLLLGLGLTQMGIGVASLVMVMLIGEAPALIVAAIARHRDSFEALQLAEFGFLFATMVAPTALMGLMFPLTTAIRADSPRSVGRSSGEVYFVNTAGAILGSLAAGFVFMPLWGVQPTIERMAVLNFAAASLIFMVSERWGMRQRLGLSAATVLLGLVIQRGVPGWDLEMFTSGPYLYAAAAVRGDEDPSVVMARVAQQQGQIVWNRDGTACTVTVKKLGDGLLQLSVNGKIDATSAEDMKTQKLIGHVPMLLHPKPRDVLVIGLGSGMTLAATLRHSPDRADFVEISPDVVYAAEHFFWDFNDGAVGHLKAHLILGDGRNHVALTNRLYDVIASEPSNPWIAGIGDLFTLHYWAKCRNRLREDGIMCQWLQAYQISEPTFRLVVRTFQHVFPHCSLWYTAGNDILLIGSKKPLALDFRALRERIGAEPVCDDLRGIGIWDAESFLAHFVAQDRSVAEFAGTRRNSLLHTDDNARLEFDMPREMFCDPQALFQSIEGILETPVKTIKTEGSSGSLIEHLVAFFPRVDPLRRCQYTFWHVNQAQNLFRAGETTQALGRLDTALDWAGDEPAAVLGVFEFLCAQARKMVARGEAESAKECFKRLEKLVPAVEALKGAGATSAKRVEKALRDDQSVRSSDVQSPPSHDGHEAP